MSEKFDGSKFIEQIARRLVAEFGFSSGAGTPGLVGAAKEGPAREQLARLLPIRVDVSSGIVVDSAGDRSRQQDIVVSEDICPVFGFDGAAEASHFPVEGVIATGEVKSTVGSSELRDIFNKSKSVKSLRRVAMPSTGPIKLEPTIDTRAYGSFTSLAVAKEEEFDQDGNSLHQIFTFGICDHFSISLDALATKAVELGNEFGLSMAPNLILSVNDGFLFPFNRQEGTMMLAPFQATGYACSKSSTAGLETLIRRLRQYVSVGKTVEYERYDAYLKSSKHETNIFLQSFAPFQDE